MKKMQSGWVILTLALLLTGAALIYSAAADGTELREGPGWRLEISENPVINPTTGVQYSSAGEMLSVQDPAYWESIPDALRAQYDTVPAVERSVSLHLTPTPEQQAREADLAGRSLSESEYLAYVYPDLWAVVPDWQKTIWDKQQHLDLTSASSAAVNPWPWTSSLTGTGSQYGFQSEPATTPFLTDDLVSSFIRGQAASSYGSGTISALNPFGTQAVSSSAAIPDTGMSAYSPFSTGTSYSASGTTLPAVGTIGAYTSVQSRSGSSSFQYYNSAQASGIIKEFGYSVAYSG